jgi:ribosomal-protein-alanine N-acetyltransferase
MSVPLQTNAGAILIRHMQVEDLGQVHAIDKASFSMPWPESAYRYELFENQSSLQWVAEGQEPDGRLQIVGMIVVWLVVDEAHIATIAVRPDYRGQGIAQELLCAALIEAIERGMRSATLEVRRHNLAAQRLYHRFHFEEVGVRPRYYRDNFEDALIMTAAKLDQDYVRWLRKSGWKSNVGPSNHPAGLASGLYTNGIPAGLMQEKDHESRG